MIVMKFGGTSLANAERIKNVSEIIKTRLEKKPIVVVSAVGGVTDILINAANESVKGINPNKKVEEIIGIHKKIIKELELSDEFLIDEFIRMHDVLNGIYLIKELTPRSEDLISSFGEILSSKILTEFLNKENLPSKQSNGWDVGIITDDKFTNAEVLDETYKNINSRLEGIDYIPIVTGFIAKNRKGEITTLGRGGSDYTASIIGAALNVDEIEIWTDVDGIKTADPRIVENAMQWEVISFNEASEMAFFGAKVLHPKTIKPAINKSIPVRILNTSNLENKGTLIIRDIGEVPFRSISLKSSIVVIRVCSTEMLLAHGFLARMFNIFDKYKISVDLVSTSEITVSMTLDNGNFKDLDLLIKDLEIIGNVEVLKNRSIICVVGAGIRNRQDILERIFGVCNDKGVGVEMMSQGASSLSISFVVKDEDSKKIVKGLHKELFENE